MGLLRDYINYFIDSNNQNALGRAGDFGVSHFINEKYLRQSALLSILLTLEDAHVSVSAL
jgi:hypothetical protein